MYSEISDVPYHLSTKKINIHLILEEASFSLSFLWVSWCLKLYKVALSVTDPSYACYFFAKYLLQIYITSIFEPTMQSQYSF